MGKNGYIIVSNCSSPWQHTNFGLTQAIKTSFKALQLSIIHTYYVWDFLDSLLQISFWFLFQETNIQDCIEVSQPLLLNLHLNEPVNIVQNTINKN